jgi:hypothetical protein
MHANKPFKDVFCSVLVVTNGSLAFPLSTDTVVLAS